jgi:uncharacterized protein YqeY
MLQSELKNALIANGSPLSESEETHILRRELKKRAEAAQAFQIAGRTEQAATEEQEAAVLAAYLPPAVDADEVRAFLRTAVEALGALEPRHKGELIKAARAKFGDALDGSLAAQLVQELF